MNPSLRKNKWPDHLCQGVFSQRSPAFLIFGYGLFLFQMIVDHKTLDFKGKMVFEKATIKAPFGIKNPMPNEACFLYVLKGIGMAFSETHKVQASPKNGILMKCGSFMNHMFSKEPDGTYEAIAVHFYPEVLEKIYQNEVPNFLKKTKGNIPENPSVLVEKDILFEKYFDGLVYYFSHPELVTDELIGLKMKELMLLLENTKDAPKLHRILSNLFSPRSYSLKEVVSSHLFSDISIDDLATLAGLSISTFKREFRKVFNDSPSHYIKAKRLERAAELLESTKRHVSEIAYECCFNDLAVFSKNFKKKFGTSPSEYRNNSPA